VDPPTTPPSPWVRLKTPAQLAELILPAPELQQLHELRDHALHQMRARASNSTPWYLRHTRGTTGLFAGEPGTGKSMAAAALANDIGLDLYRVELTRVVSKYIGETEKNLQRAFDDAEAAGAVLLFDEADALFGKRTEVEDSHDRYANLAVSYMLQRVESYAGLAILTSNRPHQIDDAFLRRIRFVVHFPFPGPQERECLWRRVFPAEANVDGLDFNRLAQIEASGGTIRDIALRAGLKATVHASPVTMAMLLDIASTELRKLGLPGCTDDVPCPPN
jgi:SpoVK/Ycf46/Vps4 family AAA+-type ATPase